MILIFQFIHSFIHSFVSFIRSLNFIWDSTNILWNTLHCIFLLLMSQIFFFLSPLFCEFPRINWLTSFWKKVIIQKISKKIEYLYEKTLIVLPLTWNQLFKISQSSHYKRQIQLSISETKQYVIFKHFLLTAIRFQTAENRTMSRLLILWNI